MFAPCQKVDQRIGKVAEKGSYNDELVIKSSVQGKHEKNEADLEFMVPTLCPCFLEKNKARRSSGFKSLALINSLNMKV